jgi:4-amino-4-deoxy-L-arabinose transferase-like glycosyltransferase
LAGFYLVSSLYIASHRLFWYDEIFTVQIARLPQWKTILSALAHGLDSQPPIYYMVVRTLDQMFGHREVAARLPSALAMAVGMLITFDCARRLTDSLHGLIALSVLTCSFLPFYGYEARPYAIFFMLASLALWIWTCTKREATWPAVYFGTTFFLGVMFHYYFFLCLVPYVLWEIVNWKPQQRPSPKLIAGLVGVALPAALLSPLVLTFSRQYPLFLLGDNSFAKLREIFSELFPDGIFLLALAFIWIVLTNRAGSSNTALTKIRPAEPLGWLFLCIPLAGFLVAQKTHAFHPRYFIGALSGVAVAFSCWLWRQYRNTNRVAVGMLLLLATWGVVKQARVVQHPEWVNPDGQQSRTMQYLKVEGPVLGDGKRFMVFRMGMLQLEASYYSKHPEQCILLLPPQGLRPSPSVKQYFGTQFWELDDLRKQARDTALIDPAPETVEAMKEAGFQAVVRFSEPMKVVYLQ